MKDTDKIFHNKVVELIKDGLCDKEISNILNVPVKKVQKTKYLYSNGLFYEKKNTKLSQEEITKIVDMASMKYNYNEIGKVLKRDPTTIYRALKCVGIPKPEPREKTFEESFYRNDEQIDVDLPKETIVKIKDAFNSGKNVDKISKMFNVSNGQVWRIIFNEKEKQAKTSKQCDTWNELILTAEKHINELSNLITKLKSL